MTLGKIIAIEGTDCSGKETQSKLLVEKLNSEGIPSQRMTFPRYDTPTGRIISQAYLGKEGKWKDDKAWFGDADAVDPFIASLYYAADRRAALPEIKRIIDSGNNLILDRYVWSNMAHQGGKIKDKEARQHMFRFISKLEYEMLGLPMPYKTIFLYMPYSVAVELRKGRREYGDLHELNEHHLRNAESAYLELHNLLGGNWKKIDCAPGGNIWSLKSPEVINEEVYKAVRNLLIK